MKSREKIRMKNIFIFAIALFAFLSYPVQARCEVDFSDDEYKSYLSSYDLSFFDSELDRDTRSFLDELGLSDFDIGSVSSLSFEKIMSLVLDIASNRAENPLKGLAAVMIYIILSSLFQSVKSPSSDMGGLYSTVSAVIVSLVLVSAVSPCITLAASSVETASDFVYAFVPVFSAITTASGSAAVSFSTNTTLLLLSQGLAFLASNAFVPVINCFLCLGICSGLRAQLNLQRLVSTLKRAITTVISFVSGLFVSVVSMKTAAASRADSLGLRSARFAVNSVVPVVGGALSEGLASIQAYSSLVKSSVGIAGICACALVFLPPVIETMIWRLALSAGLVVCDVFGERSVSLVLEAFRDTMLLLNAVLIVCALTTVISLGVIVAAGK